LVVVFPDVGLEAVIFANVTLFLGFMFGPNRALSEPILLRSCELTMHRAQIRFSTGTSFATNHD
jgi:hypothetical protein